MTAGPERKPPDLFGAIERLTNSTRRKIRRENEGTSYDEHVTVAAPWDQLCEAFDQGTRMSKVGSVPSARLPFDADVRDLRADILDTVTDALRSYDRAPAGPLPGDLRALNAAIIEQADEDLERWWEHRVHSWCRQIRTVLRLDEITSRRLRAAHGQPASCPCCGASHVLVDTDDGVIREPALLIEAREERVRAVLCSYCGMRWWAGEEFFQLQAQLAATETRDVACVGWQDDTPQQSA